MLGLQTKPVANRNRIFYLFPMQNWAAVGLTTCKVFFQFWVCVLFFRVFSVWHFENRRNTSVHATDRGKARYTIVFLHRKPTPVLVFKYDNWSHSKGKADIITTKKTSIHILYLKDIFYRDKQPLNTCNDNQTWK